MNNITPFEELKVSGKLPSPSGVALELIRLIESGKATAEGIAKLVQMDPALTGRVIQLANSAYAAGTHRPIAAVIDAVMRLGVNTVRQFALSLSVVSTNLSGACGAFDYEGFWGSAMARALAVQAISARYRCVPPQEAFTCALLSEIGRLALASVYPHEYAECLNDCAGTDSDAQLLEHEQERFFIDHRQLTLGLLRDWGFPEVLLNAIALHYRQDHSVASDNSREERFAAQLRLAAYIGRFCMAEPKFRDALLQDILLMAQALGLQQSEMEELRSEIAQQWGIWSPLLSIKTANIPPLTLTPDQQTNVTAHVIASGVRILLLGNDSEQIRRLAKNLSEERDVVYMARDGDEALKLVLNEKPQMIISDWGTSPQNGIQFCRTLRSLEFGRYIYLILLCGVNGEDMLPQAFEAGADDFIIKPVPDQVLAARIRGGKRMIQLQNELTREQEETRRAVSELAIANRRLEVMAMTDSLTSIPNRRYAFKRLEEEWAIWLRSGRALSVMVLDLDHFKSINDSFGHAVGDQILAHTAKTIRAALRTSDVVCRLGGEEFIIIASNTDMTAAIRLAERVRSTVEQHQLDAVKLGQRLTASVGLATSNAQAANSDDLLHQADEALYKAKDAGRNRVYLYSK